MQSFFCLFNSFFRHKPLPIKRLEMSRKKSKKNNFFFVSFRKYLNTNGLRRRAGWSRKPFIINNLRKIKSKNKAHPEDKPRNQKLETELVLRISKRIAISPSYPVVHQRVTQNRRPATQVVDSQWLTTFGLTYPLVS